MAFFIRVMGAPTSDHYMAGKPMIYMNDHNWRDAVVPQQASDTQIRDNNGAGMYLRTYLTPYTAGSTHLLLFTHLDGYGKFATPRLGPSDPMMDSPVLSPSITLFSMLTVDLIDAYGQEYFFSYIGLSGGSQWPASLYLTLDYSLVMGRAVLKCAPTISSPLSAFTLHYNKGSGPLMYNVPYYIKTRQPTYVGPGHSGGYRLKATPDGKLFQTPDTDVSAPTRFYFMPVSSTAPANVYSIRSDFGLYVCITDAGKIEPRTVVGPWEQFEVARDWWVPGRFLITKLYDNDPYKVYGLRFSTTDTSVTTWKVGTDQQSNNDSFEMHPVVPGFYE